MARDVLQYRLPPEADLLRRVSGVPLVKIALLSGKALGNTSEVLRGLKPVNVEVLRAWGELRVAERARERAEAVLEILGSPGSARE